MKNESGKSTIKLLICIILIIIGATVIVKYAQKILLEKEIQDLRTDMLLMQAEVKKGLEEVCFNSVNLDKTKEEDLQKINEIKQEYLDGIILSDAPSEVQEAVKNVPEITFDENCYYLEMSLLEEMGITNFAPNKIGYFIVKYDFSNADVEIINTKGYNGKYTLTQMIETIEETQ